MEAIFIIYAISWLIFLAIYIGYSLKFKEEAPLWKKFKWYELVLMFLFAPIVLFFFFVS